MSIEQRLERMEAKIDGVGHNVSNLEIEMTRQFGNVQTSMAAGSARFKALENQSHSPGSCDQGKEFAALQQQAAGARKLGKGAWALIVLIPTAVAAVIETIKSLRQ